MRRLSAFLRRFAREPKPRKSRRAFIGGFVWTCLAAPVALVAYTVLRYLTPPLTAEAVPDEVEAGTTEDPELVEKGFKIVRYGSEPVILIRCPNGAYRAFEAHCTHLACVVYLDQARQLIACNCHAGAYDLGGRRVAGPPPRPLTEFRVRTVASATRGPDTILVSKADA